MPNPQCRLDELVEMSRILGQPENGYVILGEGNTSARITPDTFAVKASGVSLQGIDRSGFVEVKLGPLLQSLDAATDDDSVLRILDEAKTDPQAPRPSVETFLHAVAIQEGGAELVAHTHPTAVNRVLCSNFAKQAVQGRLFPDEIVSCGPASLFLPYFDPGVTLARQFRTSLATFVSAHGEPPRVVLIQNHGLIVLGRTVPDVLSTTAMTVKAFEILWGTYALGGPHFLGADQVARIAKRPDEAYRRRMLGGDLVQ